MSFCPYVGVWDKILEPVACVRKESEMLQLFPAYLKGEDLFGLTVSAVARIAESVSAGAEAGEPPPVARRTLLNTGLSLSQHLKVVVLSGVNSCRSERKRGIGSRRCLRAHSVGQLTRLSAQR